MKIEEIILEQIDFYLEKLRQKILFEQDLPSMPLEQNMEQDPLLTGNADPTLDQEPGTDPSLEMGDESIEQEESDIVEEPTDPVDKSFEDLKSIAETTDDVTEIISAIKSLAQDTFSTPDSPDDTRPDINLLFQKIVDDSESTSNLIKKALERPELEFLKSEVIIPSVEANTDSGED
jgi:hypothetical protein